MGMSQQHHPLPWQPEIGFHTRFRETRIQYGEIIGTNLTQDGFARLLHTEQTKVTGGMVRQWEAGNGKPKDPEVVARRVATVTGVDPGWLLTGLTGSLAPAPLPDPDGGGKIIPLTTRKKVRDVQKSQYIYTVRAA